MSFKIKAFSLTLAFAALLLASCTKETPKEPGKVVVGDVETFQISNTALKNCRFKNIDKDGKAKYTYGATIEPNVILCDEGVATKVEKISPAAYPNGITFSMAQMALTGTANERVTDAPYEFFLENAAGYVIVKIQISIQ